MSPPLIFTMSPSDNFLPCYIDMPTSNNTTEKTKRLVSRTPLTSLHSFQQKETTLNHLGRGNKTKRQFQAKVSKKISEEKNQTKTTSRQPLSPKNMKTITPEELQTQVLQKNKEKFVKDTLAKLPKGEEASLSSINVNKSLSPVEIPQTKKINLKQNF